MQWGDSAERFKALVRSAARPGATDGTKRTESLCALQGRLTKPPDSAVVIHQVTRLSYLHAWPHTPKRRKKREEEEASREVQSETIKGGHLRGLLT